MERSQRGPLLLVLGAGMGVALAATGLLASAGGTGGALPPGAVARVNGEAVRLDDYQRALGALASDRREGIGPDDRRLVLDRVIEEELLVQRGLELGLARRDARVRRDLTAAVIDAAVAGTDGVEPTEKELEAFYARNRDLFVRSGRLRVRQVWCRAERSADDGSAGERARRATERLRAGEAFEAVRDSEGDREPALLPDTLLPVAKLADYLGPTALATALALAPGAVSDPVRSATGFHVLQVIAREPDGVPALGEIHDQVVAEFRRHAGDEALRAYLNELRARAVIDVAPVLP
jgi:parvulin-like peptidyl-prolyl isomerase